MEKLGAFLMWGLGISAIVFPLVIEAIKKLVGEAKIKSEYLALIVSVILGAGVCATGYIFDTKVFADFTQIQLIASIIIFIFLSTICSQLGYDYVFKAIFGKNEDKK